MASTDDALDTLRVRIRQEIIQREETYTAFCQRFDPPIAPRHLWDFLAGRRNLRSPALAAMLTDLDLIRDE